jgi:methyl-accepting chemotaxis protein
MRNPFNSVGMKLFSIFFFCIVILVLIVGLLSYSVSKNIIEEKIAVSTKQTIMQASNKLENVLRNIEDIAFQKIQDTDFQTNLGVITDKTLDE